MAKSSSIEDALWRKSRILFLCRDAAGVDKFLHSAGFERIGKHYVFESVESLCFVSGIDDAMGEIIPLLSEKSRSRRIRSVIKTHRGLVPRPQLSSVIIDISCSWLLDVADLSMQDFIVKVRSELKSLQDHLRTKLTVYILVSGAGVISGFDVFTRKVFSSDFLRLNIMSARKSPRCRIDEFQVVMRARAMGAMTNPETLIEEARDIHGFRAGAEKFFDRLKMLSDELCSDAYYDEPPTWGEFIIIGNETKDGLPPATHPPGTGPPDQANIFLKGILAGQILDASSAWAITSKVKRRRLLVSYPIALMGFIALLLIFCFSTFSFIKNRQLVRSTKELVHQSRAVTFPQRGWLEAIHDLGERVAALEQVNRERAPWHLSFGLYQGNRLLEQTRMVFLQQVNKGVMGQVLKNVEKTLVHELGGGRMLWGRRLGAFKRRKLDQLSRLYRMFDKPTAVKPEAAALTAAEVFVSHRNLFLSYEDKSTLQRTLHRFFSSLKEGRIRVGPISNELADRVLILLSYNDVHYERLVRSCPQVRKSATGAGARFMALQDALASGLLSFKANSRIPEIYSSVGWQACFLPRLKQMFTDESALGAPGRPRTPGSGSLTTYPERYVDQAIEAWREFLTSLKAKKPSNIHQVLPFIDDLLKSPALHSEIVRAVAQNTDLPLKKGRSSGANGVSRLDDRIRRAAHRLRQHFKGAQKLLAKDFDRGGHASAIDAYLEQRSVRDANDIDHLYERIDKEASA